MAAKWRDKYHIDPQELEIVWCDVQSGTSFDLRDGRDASDANLSQQQGALIVTLACKYSQVTANITRTLLLNAKKDQKLMYSFTADVLDHTIQSIKCGLTFSEVYENCRSYVEQNRPELVDRLVNSVGQCLCTEYRDPALALVKTNTSAVVEGRMALSVSVGFNNLVAQSGGGYAIWLADTVLIPEDIDESPQVLVTSVTRDLQKISYELEDEESTPTEKPPADKKQDGATATDEKGKSPKKKEKPKTKSSSTAGADDKIRSKEKKQKRKEAKGKSPRSSTDRSPQTTSSSTPSTTSAAATAVSAAVLNNADSVIIRDRLRKRDKGANDVEVEDRDARQRELRIKKHQEIRARLESGQEGGDVKGRKTQRKMDAIRCFEKFDTFPRDLRLNKLYVDNRSEALLVPINGLHVPFHVMTLKNVTCNPEEGEKYHTMRINFQVPGSQTLTTRGEENPLPELGSDGNSMFIKELLYRSEDGRHLQTIHRSIKELIKRVKQKETEADVARDLASQDHLQINRSSRRVMLKDLLVRPNISGARKVMGSLEAHANGCRCQENNRVGAADYVDVTYANIKHAVFQPCERELIVLIHFHLKSPIMVGKKKTQDVQFYCEAGSQTDDLDVRRKNYGDPDEMQEEIRDREIRRRLNNAFKGFVQQVEEMSGMEFDVPYRELMFFGVPLKSNAEILPTANCLVHLVEWPPFVLPLEDIEVVSFERVQHGLRNFDMVFVFQDYAKPVRTVNTIPTEYLDNLKRWLNELDIVWYENKQNLNWNVVMKTIREDVEGFVSMGGFEDMLGDGTVKFGDGESEPTAASVSATTGRVDDDDSDDDEEDEEYEEEVDSGDEESDDSDDDSEESLADESEDESFHDMDSDEEEGLSWDELEERAKRDDRKRGFEQEEPAGARRKQQKQR
eukprot:GHVS01068054.1.p1 GENE.GHVS01068054.1~~GHVS01068054.1.p1  ORF type:complete len:908 (+),score=157.09 GHVS01068054.1:521-3244(+)